MRHPPLLLILAAPALTAFVPQDPTTACDESGACRVEDRARMDCDDAGVCVAYSMWNAHHFAEKYVAEQRGDTDGSVYPVYGTIDAYCEPPWTSDVAVCTVSRLQDRWETWEADAVCAPDRVLESAVVCCDGTASRGASGCWSCTPADLTNTEAPGSP